MKNTALIPLFLLFCGLLCLPAGAEAPERAWKDLTVQEAQALIQERQGDPQFFLLDVQTPGEYAKGHLAGAVNLDFYADDFRERLAELDRTKVYLVYCYSGRRSERAAEVLVELGFGEIYNMLGGMIAWRKADLPMERSSD